MLAQNFLRILRAISDILQSVEILLLRIFLDESCTEKKLRNNGNSHFCSLISEFQFSEFCERQLQIKNTQNFEEKSSQNFLTIF